jgi:hypothetical protein
MRRGNFASHWDRRPISELRGALVRTIQRGVGGGATQPPSRSVAVAGAREHWQDAGSGKLLVDPAETNPSGFLTLLRTPTLPASLAGSQATEERRLVIIRIGARQSALNRLTRSSEDTLRGTAIECRRTAVVPACGVERNDQGHRTFSLEATVQFALSSLTHIP